jgi:hypothetical protein
VRRGEWISSALGIHDSGTPANIVRRNTPRKSHREKRDKVKGKDSCPSIQREGKRSQIAASTNYRLPHPAGVGSKAALRAGAGLKAFPARRSCAILPAWDPGISCRGAERPKSAAISDRQAAFRGPHCGGYFRYRYREAYISPGSAPPPCVFRPPDFTGGKRRSEPETRFRQRVGAYQSNPQPRRTQFA